MLEERPLYEDNMNTINSSSRSTDKTHQHAWRHVNITNITWTSSSQ